MKGINGGYGVCGAFSRRRSFRFFLGLGLGLFVLSFVTGCPWLTMWQQMQDYYRALEEQINALPSFTVRIVNETGVTARVELASGITGPEMPSDPYGYYFPPSTEEYKPIADSKQVLVAAGGTVTGTLKCGEVIGVSVTAPADQETPEYYYSETAFGLYVTRGNVRLSGIGSAATDSFSGDIVSGARFVRPGTDGLDCTTQTLVITICGTDPITATLSVE